ncbi:MAG: hypothetical protein WCP79_06615 [Bacillota bacterium]
MKIKKVWLDPEIEFIDVATTLSGGGTFDDHDTSHSPPPSS